MENTLLHKVYEMVNHFIHLDDLRHVFERKESTSFYKTCPVTGLDISMQPRNSKFLSKTGVEWYFEHNFKTYSDILLPFLTEHWKDRPIEEQFREIAHNIRNHESNPRNNTRRKIKRILSDKNSLFDPVALIDKKKLKEARMEGLLK
jgi:hypothetical protein